MIHSCTFTEVRQILMLRYSGDQISEEISMYVKFFTHEQVLNTFVTAFCREPKRLLDLVESIASL